MSAKRAKVERQKARSLERLAGLCLRRAGGVQSDAATLYATIAAQLPSMSNATQRALLDAMERTLDAVGAARVSAQSSICTLDRVQQVCSHPLITPHLT